MLSIITAISSINRILILIAVVSFGFFAVRQVLADQSSGTIGGVSYTVYANQRRNIEQTNTVWSGGNFELAAIDEQFVAARGYNDDLGWHQVGYQYSGIQYDVFYVPYSDVQMGGYGYPDPNDYSCNDPDITCYGASRHKLINGSSTIYKYQSDNGQWSCYDAYWTAGDEC